MRRSCYRLLRRLYLLRSYLLLILLEGSKEIVLINLRHRRYSLSLPLILAHHDSKFRLLLPITALRFKTISREAPQRAFNLGRDGIIDPVLRRRGGKPSAIDIFGQCLRVQLLDPLDQCGILALEIMSHLVDPIEKLRELRQQVDDLADDNDAELHALALASESLHHEFQGNLL